MQSTFRHLNIYFDKKSFPSNNGNRNARINFAGVGHFMGRRFFFTEINSKTIQPGENKKAHPNKVRFLSGLHGRQYKKNLKKTPVFSKPSPEIYAHTKTTAISSRIDSNYVPS